MPALPALYGWEVSSTWREETLFYQSAVRAICLQYIFPQLAKPNAMMARHGLMTAVEHVFQRGAARGYHPQFAYGTEPTSGAAYPLGTPLFRSLNLMEWSFVNGQPGFLAPAPSGAATSAAGSTQGAVQRGFPAYQATFQVVERILPEQASAADTAQDALLNLAINEDPGNPALGLDVLSRVLPFPDGGADEP